MKRLLLANAIFFFISCNHENVQTPNNCTDLENKNASLELEIRQLKDSILLLKYPASDRLISIKKLVSENNLSEAKKQISELRNAFPKSKEVQLCLEVEALIQKKEEQKKEDEEKRKALGFKVFKDNTTAKVGKVSLVTSGYNFGRTYTFDSCPDIGKYYYDTAEKDKTFLLISLAGKSSVR